MERILAQQMLQYRKHVRNNLDRCSLYRMAKFCGSGLYELPNLHYTQGTVPLALFLYPCSDSFQLRLPQLPSCEHFHHQSETNTYRYFQANCCTAYSFERGTFCSEA